MTSSTGRAIVVFLVASRGHARRRGDARDRRQPPGVPRGINGVIFGATVLAAASALPEISSGIAAVRLGDNQLAVADIFGGNAFQVCLFLLADLIAGKPVLPDARAS